MKSFNKKLALTCLVFILIMVQAASVFAGTSYTTLKFGSRGSEVVKLQQALNNKGYNSGTADGIYGKLTENAVIGFQKANGLIIDGIAGNQTQTALYSQIDASRSVTTTRTSDAFKLYETNLYWMSRIIHAEAEAEPYSGKVAVGSVIMNRVNSSLFPNSVKEVIFEDYKGIAQFSPVSNGTIYNTPSAESVQAAEDALNGVQPVGTATYFFNPAKSAGTWIVQNKIYVKTIGNHAFYR